jgi:type III secretion system YscD/HrpQ family protein
MPAHLIAEEGPLQGLILNLEEGDEWTIGRDPDSVDFLLEDSTVSRKHARVFRTPEGLYFENLSRVNPALVNGEAASTPVVLKQGDRLQIGATLFAYSENPLPEDQAPPEKKRKTKSSGAYDDIFGELEEPSPPPHKEPEDIPRETVGRVEEESPYDTIFEDESANEELPFSLLSSTPLLLKVVSGPNAGAEFGLDKGRSYIIGKDPNSCDIAFQDLSVSRTHARLTIDPEGILEIEDLGSKNGTFVSGQPVTEKRILTPQDMIALGTTVFLIIDREAPQETIYSPVLPTHELPPVEPTVPEPILPTEEDWKKKPIPTKHLVIGGSFFAIFFVIFLSFFSLFRSESIQLTKKEPVDHLSEALAKYSAVQFSFNPASGKLFLVGHVLTAVEYQELTYRLSEISFIQSVENTVVIDELVWKMTNDVINDNPAWRSVSIHSPQAGQFVANGYLKTNEEAAALADYLNVNFPYLDRLKNEVVVEQNLQAEVQNSIQSAGLGGVVFQLSNGEIVLSGRYSNKMEDEYRDLIKKLNQLKGVARVKDVALAVAPNAAGIDISQQFQVGGSSMREGRGYSVILNGKIYTIGDLVEGMTLTAIEPTTILLEKDGLRYRIDYTR